MTQERLSFDKPQGQSPLRKFSGVLKEIKRNVGHDESTGKTWETAQFDFTDIEVIEATEPYPWPTASIFVRYVSPATARDNKSRWAVLAQSIRNLSVDIYDHVGSRMTWAMLPGTIRGMLEDEDGHPLLVTEGPKAGQNVWGDTTADCWQVVSIEGVAGPESGGDILDYVADLLDGKTEQEFKAVLFVDAKARANPMIIEQATKQELLSTLQAAGVAYRTEDGVWHKGSNGNQPVTDKAATQA